jgi:hypothetical protein
MIYPRPLTAQEMIEDFGVPKHLAYFIEAIENGETDGCCVVESQEDSGDVVPGEDGKE